MSQWASYDAGGQGGYQNNSGYQQQQQPSGVYQPPPQQPPPQQPPPQAGVDAAKWMGAATNAATAAGMAAGMGVIPGIPGVGGMDEQTKKVNSWVSVRPFLPRRPDSSDADDSAPCCGLPQIQTFFNLAPFRFYFEVSRRHSASTVLFVLACLPFVEK
jgi:hypothetical protein